jgi:hypothetical protein
MNSIELPNYHNIITMRGEPSELRWKYPGIMIIEPEPVMERSAPPLWVRRGRDQMIRTHGDPRVSKTGV